MSLAFIGCHGETANEDEGVKVREAETMSKDQMKNQKRVITEAAAIGSHRLNGRSL